MDAEHSMKKSPSSCSVQRRGVAPALERIPPGLSRLITNIHPIRRCHIAILSLVLLAAGPPNLHAGTELNFWHSYLHAQTSTPHFSFNLAKYKRGLFFGSCGPSTRSQQWLFTFDLTGDGPAYSLGQITLTSDEPRAVKVTGGAVTIDTKHDRAVIALQIDDAGLSTAFVGNGTYRIHRLK
jgi:hypothetical protein